MTIASPSPSAQRRSGPVRPQWRGVVEEFRERLPVAPGTPAVTLLEGGTPLVPARILSERTGAQVFLKVEGANPTGSFKDRGMTMAITQAAAAGARAVICASTGNTSASAAAYAVRAGMTCAVLVPQGKIALGKLAQAMMHGAVVIQIKGNFDAGMQLVKEVAEEAPVTIVNSINPYRLQGQKTAAFEIIEELGRAPDFHCLPVGNAGNITAHWIGYCEYSSASGDHVTAACSLCKGHCKYAGGAIVGNRPRMVGYQAAGSAPFMRGAMVDNPETVATAIRIGHPQSWDNAWQVKEESGGWFDECTDEDILAAQKLLAEREGVFCEPASATSLAGAMRDIQSGKIPEGSSVVCTLTGHGLKDPDTAIKQSSAQPLTVDATLAAVKTAILDNMS